MFYFRFNNADERQTVLEHGSLFIAGKLFVIKPWSIQVERTKVMSELFQFGLIFYNVPKALWSDDRLAFVGSRLGKPWCMDDATAERERFNFVRIFIEVGIDFDYPKTLKFKLKNGAVVCMEAEYPWKPPGCLKCNVFGHSTVKV